ncbi:MAG: signal recognition particle protein [Firmicutes bacterium]|jgi:signal recognition particle subunit SRP54|nr:signal recognition particle protein [Bacillota bacterium]
MFENLTDRFEGIVKKIKSKGRLSEEDIDSILRDIRIALLEADVALSVVQDFITNVKQRCLSMELSKSLTPAQQIIKYVNEELTAILGGEQLRISYAPKPPTVILLAGLQGSGKTTTVAKLGRWFKQQGRHPLLVGADLARPAAVEQLRILGSEAGLAVFSEPTDPVSVARRGLEEALRVGRDVVIVDTAGRLSIDQVLMEEVRRVSVAVQPHYTFLVIDAMTGQDAVNTAKAFHETLELDGIILTKVDGDARGGAALSVKQVAGKPIAFVTTGEKINEIETFYPERMASRILGMGDVLSLIEKAEAEVDKQLSAKAMDRLKSGRFTLDDFYDQIQQMKKMGPLQSLVSMLPGMPKEVRNANIDDADITRIEAIITSMTVGEREEPQIINGSRRSRIAKGSGTSVTDVNNLLKQFAEMQKLFKSSGVMGQLMNSSSRKAKKKSKSGKSKR